MIMDKLLRRRVAKTARLRQQLRPLKVARFIGFGRESDAFVHIDRRLFGVPNHRAGHIDTLPADHLRFDIVCGSREQSKLQPWSNTLTLISA
jgi:hypothetical protein